MGNNADPRCLLNIAAERKKKRKLKELLQTPDEIIEVLKALIFAKDDMQPLIDGSTNKMVSSTNALRLSLHILRTLATN
jgi:hypothetical protein